MASSFSLIDWKDLFFQQGLQKAKPKIAEILLKSLRSDGSALDDRTEQPCGIWLIGALNVTLADLSGIDPFSQALSTSCKKYKPDSTTDDARILTALLRFVAKKRSDAEIEDLFAHLDNINGCYCSNFEDARAKDFILVHTLHDIGWDIMESYRRIGYFLPVISHKGSFQHQVQALPQSFIHLRGRESSPFKDLQAYNYLPPICPPNHALPGIGFITAVFVFLASVLESRISPSFSKGRSKYWPYSPREFLLLIEESAAQNTSTSTSDDTAACASNLVLAIQEWSYWMPSPSPIFLLTRILVMCGTLIVPAIVEYSYSVGTLLDVATEIIHDSMNSLREINRAEPSLSHFSSRKAVGLFVFEHCNTITTYLWMTMGRRDVPLEWNDTMLPENCLRLSQICTAMMYLLEDVRIPFSIRNSNGSKQIRESMRHLCFKYHSMARILLHGHGVPYPGMGMVCHPLLAQHYADVRSDPNEMFTVDPLIKPPGETSLVVRAREYVLGVLPNLRKRTYCCAWGCSKSIQEVGGDFKACSACGITKYCGRACQKLDWKGFTSSGDPLPAAEHQHSKICRLLQKLSTGSSDKEAFAGEVILEDQHWHTLATWTESLYPTDVELPSPQASEKLDSPDSQSDEALFGWEDFNDVLLEFVVLAGAPEPVSITWMQTSCE